MTNAELKRLEKLLAEAPSTVAECSALLSLPRRRVQIGIWQLTHKKRAHVVGVAANPDAGPPGYKRQLNLYSTQAPKPA